MRARAVSLSAWVIFSFLIRRSRLPETVARPFWTAASEISTMTMLMPETAQACAMPLPMVPAPMMPTVEMLMWSALFKVKQQPPSYRHLPSLSVKVDRRQRRRDMFDYIVVGGGSAGCVLAGRLSEDPAVRVCLLEAGPADGSVLIHCPAGLAVMAKYELNGWGYATVPQPGLNGRRGYQPRGKVLGGSSSINAMIYARGHASDYDGWAAQGNPGWSFADVLPYFKRSEHNQRGADAWHGQGGPLNVLALRSPTPFLPSFIEAGRQAGPPLNADFNGPEQEGI